MPYGPCRAALHFVFWLGALVAIITNCIFVFYRVTNRPRDSVLEGLGWLDSATQSAAMLGAWMVGLRTYESRVPLVFNWRSRFQLGLWVLAVLSTALPWLTPRDSLATRSETRSDLIVMSYVFTFVRTCSSGMLILLLDRFQPQSGGVEGSQASDLAAAFNSFAVMLGAVYVGSLALATGSGENALDPDAPGTPPFLVVVAWAAYLKAVYFGVESALLKAYAPRRRVFSYDSIDVAVPAAREAAPSGSGRAPIGSSGLELERPLLAS
jgi:hypothetical protein